MNLQKVHLNPSTRIRKFIGTLLMIRPIERKSLTKIFCGFLFFCCLFWTLNRSFLCLNAQSTNHDHQTMTGGRLEWEINTYDTVQDITIDGTTFRAGGIIILNYYLTNTSTGTIRTYWTGFNSGWYTAANVYTYGATISNVAYSGSAGITFKINNPTDRVTIIISFNGTDMNTSLAGITSFSSATTLTDSESEVSAVQDIDVKLQGVASTLSQILALLGSGNVPITEYLSEIEAYSAYLEDISVSLDDIDNDIDTITWIDLNATYLGYSTELSYNPASLNTGGLVNNGTGYIYQQVTIMPSVTSYFPIFKVVFPAEFLNNYQTYEFGFVGSNNALVKFDILMSRSTRGAVEIYFTADTPYYGIYNVKYCLKITGNNITVNPNNYKGVFYINENDIEYWTLLQAMQNKKLLDYVSQLVVAQDSSSVVDPINDKIDELNDVTQQTQTIENQQIDNLESFNQSIDFDDYDFDFTNRNGIEYFKLKLTNIYDIEEFKPFYLIPIMLFILGVILRG